MTLTGKSQALHQIGKIHMVRGNLEEALKFYQQSLEIAESIGDSESKAIVLGDIVQIHMRRGNLDSGLELSKETLAIAKESGNMSLAGAALDNIASIFVKRGDLDNAMKLYQQSLEIAIRLGELDSKGVILHNMAGIYVERGDLHMAKKLYQQALDITKELGDLQGEATTLAKMSEIDALEMNYREALEKLLSAMNTIARIGANSLVESFANNIKALQSMMGFNEFEVLWKELTGQALPEWLSQTYQEEQYMTAEQFIARAIQAAREKRPEAEEYFKYAQKMAADTSAPKEVQELGKVIQGVMLGDKNVDLSGLPDEFAEAIRTALK